MPNFDALRSAIIGPLEYICRPKVKPAELLALFPFNGDLLDISNYGRICSTNDATFSDTGPLGKCVAFTGSILHTQSAQWSIDFFGNFTNGNDVMFGLSCSRDTRGNALWGASNGNVMSSIIGSNAGVGTQTGVFAHFALTYDGSNLCTYVNGVRKLQQTTSLNTQTTITSIKKAYLQLSNLRVVGKCLTSDTSFPVPADFYTGYEAL